MDHTYLHLKCAPQQIRFQGLLQNVIDDLVVMILERHNVLENDVHLLVGGGCEQDASQYLRVTVIRHELGQLGAMNECQLSGTIRIQCEEFRLIFVKLNRIQLRYFLYVPL